MEWIYLVLILAFIIWCFQMVVVFKRTVRRYDDQIEQIRSSTAQTNEQAARYESEQKEKKEELEAARRESKEADEEEQELQKKVAGLKESEASRRPTRFKVEGMDGDRES